jgi:2,7-dihydroxy-5-methyl-1-naphthoate 7-O-methyltransferase
MSASIASDPSASDGRRLRLLADAQLSRAIQVAATLRVADHMGDEAQPAAELARRTSCDEGALRRLLRYLAFAGVFEETGEGRFGLTRMGRLLRTVEPGSLQATLAIGPDNRALWWSTGELLHAVRTGRPAYDHVYGMSLWDTLRAGKGSSTRFQRSMAESSDEILDSLLPLHDWAGVATVADVGGGTGALLIRLLRANPRLRGLLVDLPSVAEQASEAIGRAGLADRCAVAAGDLLEQVPAGADLYLLMRVLHDWPDRAAVSILRNCRKACGQTGRVLLVDMEVGASDPTGESLASDMMMLLLVGGKERTLAELTQLLAEAGLSMTKRTALRPPYVAIEAAPV